MSEDIIVIQEVEYRTAKRDPFTQQQIEGKK